MARGESPILRRSIHDSPRVHSSPGRNGSPSRSQLAEFELHRTIAQLSIATVEQQKVYNAQKTAFQEELDAREEALAASQLSQIEQAIASHDLAREQAQAVLEAHLEAEREKERQRIAEQKRREEEERRRREEAERLAREEEERRIREQTEREEAARRAEADRRRLEEERRQKAAEDAERREQERQQDERRKAEAEAEAEAQAQAQAQAQADAARDAKQRADEVAKKAAAQASSPANTEREHQSYLAIHKRLKALRVKFWADCRSGPNVQYRKAVGELRREVRAEVNKLSAKGSKDNALVLKRINAHIKTGMEDTISPPVPVNDILPISQTLPDPSPTVPTLAVYLLSCFAKEIIRFTINSASNATSTRPGEAPGLLAVQVFCSTRTFTHPTPDNPQNVVTLIPILLAKYHLLAPPLFGISGSEKTQKTRLGWRAEEDPSTGQKAYVPESQQYDRLNGLGCGYAAVALRNFAKSKNQNPYPPRNFWTSLAYIINTPPEQVQVTHLVLLKGILDGSAERIIQFWGATGVAALRQALVVFPSTLPQELKNHSEALKLAIMRESWEKDLRFHLT